MCVRSASTGIVTEPGTSVQHEVHVRTTSTSNNSTAKMLLYMYGYHHHCSAQSCYISYLLYVVTNLYAHVYMSRIIFGKYYMLASVYACICVSMCGYLHVSTCTFQYRVGL